MPKPATFERHLAAIQSGQISEGTIRGIKKRLNNWERNGCGLPDWKPAYTDDEADRVLWAVRRHEPLIADSQQIQKGIDWLRDKRRYRHLPPHAQAVVETFRAFRLVDFTNPEGHRFNWQPVYRVIGWEGRFDYQAVPWQSQAYGGPVLPIRVLL